MFWEQLTLRWAKTEGKSHNSLSALDQLIELRWQASEEIQRKFEETQRKFDIAKRVQIADGLSDELKANLYEIIFR